MMELKLGRAPRGRRVPLRVEDVLSARFLAVGADEPVGKVAEEMRSKRAGSAVVVDGDGRPVGIITGADLAYAYSKGLPPSSPAWMVMMEDPLTVKDSELITRAIEKVREAGVRQLPVVDEKGRLVGVVDTHDLLSAASTLLSLKKAAS